mmetsp:Transcript_3771/g.12700  ORF Transcript_3771/g.12700 Transcript_3771/m.12700 type:complete len:252 (-) Transcript_3771:217-972(-)
MEDSSPFSSPASLKLARILLNSQPHSDSCSVSRRCPGEQCVSSFKTNASCVPLYLMKTPSMPWHANSTSRTSACSAVSRFAKDSAASSLCASCRALGCSTPNVDPSPAASPRAVSMESAASTTDTAFALRARAACVGVRGVSAGNPPAKEDALIGFANIAAAAASGPRSVPPPLLLSLDPVSATRSSVCSSAHRWVSPGCCASLECNSANSTPAELPGLPCRERRKRTASATAFSSGSTDACKELPTTRRA